MPDIPSDAHLPVDMEPPAASAADPSPVEAQVPMASAATAQPEAAEETASADIPPDAVPQDMAAPAEPAAAKIPEMSPAACAAKLAELFPALFGPEGPPKPLKLRIQADIQQRAPGLFTRRTLSLFLSRYTTGNAYIRSLLQSTTRFDLDGQPAGEISDEHRQAATDELARRRALHEERRAAERAAQREAQREAEKAARQQHQAAQADHQAQRDRAFALRAFETSSLTKANFCALKGVTEAELDAQLELARKERAERPAQPPQQPHARPERRDTGGMPGSSHSGKPNGPPKRPHRGPRPAPR